MCLVVPWTHRENVPTPPPPGHPAHHVPDQVPTSSPNPLGVTGPSVRGCQIPPWSLPPSNQLAPCSRRQASQRAGDLPEWLGPWVLIPAPPPPGGHTQDLHSGGPGHPRRSCPQRRDNSYPAGPHQLRDLGRATFQKRSPLEGVIC